ncbi:MAG: FAD-dependent cmnm(5)s(2)U34 oxidoreductase, partial [Giesbergeria sp.]
MTPSTPSPIASTAFLRGCGLPAAWAGAAQWRILDTHGGSGLSFLETWAAWCSDPKRPTMLHYVALSPGPLDAAALLGATQHRPDLHARVESLTAQAWGLLPGVHRLGFEGGRVLLTLAIGDAQSLLRKERWRVDTVLASSTAQLQASDGPKALARCAERGTRLVGLAGSTEVRGAMVQAGFALEPASSESGDP